MQGFLSPPDGGTADEPSRAVLLGQLRADYPAVPTHLLARHLDRAWSAARQVTGPEGTERIAAVLARDQLDSVLAQAPTSPSASWGAGVRNASAHDALEARAELVLICEAAAAHLEAASVAVSVPDHRATLEVTGASGRVAQELEELQVLLDEGPSLDGVRGVGPTLVLDLAAKDPQARWPSFAPAAAELGVGSLYVQPMRIGIGRFAVFTVYLHRVGGLAPDAMGKARTLASTAHDLLLLAQCGARRRVDHALGPDALARGSRAGKTEPVGGPPVAPAGSGPPHHPAGPSPDMHRSAAHAAAGGQT